MDYSSPYLWLSLGFFLILLEMLLPGLFLLWIGLAALFVAVPAAFLDLDAAVFCLLFVGAMGVSIKLGVKIQARKAGQASGLNQGLSSYVGTTATVAELSDATPNAVRIHLAGTTYSAVCDQVVQVGDAVKITALNNGQFLVQKLIQPCVEGDGTEG